MMPLTAQQMKFAALNLVTNAHLRLTVLVNHLELASNVRTDLNVALNLKLVSR